MPVIDFILDALGVIENIFSAAIVALLTYMILGGWKFVFRAVSFFFDTQLVKLIGTVFSYFQKIITLDMFNQTFIDALMRNIYMFIGVIMFFRLMMLVIKYLINPDMVNDNKAGVNALVQRVIIGSVGILFIPTIFNIANDFQVAILNDGIIQQIIVPSDMVDAVEAKVEEGGNYIGTYVLAGFISPNNNANKSDKDQFKLGVSKGDLSNLDVNDGGFLTQKFKYDYFFFISTLALAYVFYYILKYCIDIAGRAFRLLLYKMLTPVAMIEYMINGSQDGVFKQWLQASLSTYFMLFIRIIAVWFVMLITVLMGDNATGYGGTLLTEDDYFLRAIIVIALLGFMMDLPKLVGTVFGLDLEQEGGASAVFKQVGGMMKGAAIGGLAVGGAAAGSLMGGLGSAVQARREGKAQAKGEIGQQLKEKLNNGEISKKDFRSQMRSAAQDNTKKNLDKVKDSSGSMFRAGASSILGAALGANQFTGAAYSKFDGSKSGVEKASQNDNGKSAAASKAKEKAEQAALREEDITRNITERVVETMPRDSSREQIINAVMGQMTGVTSQGITSEVQGQLSSIQQNGGTVDQATVTQTVNRVLNESGVNATPEQVEQVVNRVVASGGDITSVDSIQQVVETVRADNAPEEVTQVVNQTYGTRINNAVDDVNQTVHQVLEQEQHISSSVDNMVKTTNEISSNVSQSVEISREINDTVNEQLNISKEINDEVKVLEDIQVNQDIRNQQDLGTFMPDTFYNNNNGNNNTNGTN